MCQTALKSLFQVSLSLFPRSRNYWIKIDINFQQNFKSAKLPPFYYYCSKLLLRCHAAITSVGYIPRREYPKKSGFSPCFFVRAINCKNGSRKRGALERVSPPTSGGKSFKAACRMRDSHINSRVLRVAKARRYFRHVHHHRSYYSEAEMETRAPPSLRASRKHQ